MADESIFEKEDQNGHSFTVWKTYSNLMEKTRSKTEDLKGTRAVSREEAKKIADALDSLGWDLKGVPKKKMQATCLHLLAISQDLASIV